MWRRSRAEQRRRRHEQTARRRRRGCSSRPSCPVGARAAPASWGSMIPLASSPRRVTVDWIAKTVVTIAIMAMSMESRAATPVPPRVRNCRAAARRAGRVMASMTEPKSRAMMHHRHRPPDDRTALEAQPRARGVRRRRAGADEGPARSGSSPAPWSRRASKGSATAMQRTGDRRSSSQRPPRVRAVGLHLLAPPDRGGPRQAHRRRGRRPCAARRSPGHDEASAFAPREVEVTWPATAPTPMPNSPTPATEAPMISEPVIPAPGSSPLTADTAATPTPTATHSGRCTTHAAQRVGVDVRASANEAARCAPPPRRHGRCG